MQNKDNSTNWFVGVVGCFTFITVEVYYLWAEKHIPEFYQLILGFGVGCVSFIFWFGVLFGFLWVIVRFASKCD